MQMLKIREQTIGDGHLLLCAPMVAKNQSQLLEEAQKIQESTVDMVEWRLDQFEERITKKQLEELLVMLRTTLKEKLLLVTIRTKKEGGAFDADMTTYVERYSWVLQTQLADLIDVEYQVGHSIYETLIDIAHANGCKVIISAHDFMRTPSVSSMCEQLTKMAESKADIIKLAVMPKEPADVAALLQASAIVSSCSMKPLITMSMGSMGAISRLIGKLFGSCVSFVNVCGSSAPGQIDLIDATELLGCLRKILGENLF